MDKYLQIIASASLFRGIAKTEIAAVLQNLDAQLRVYPRNSFIWQLGEQVTTAGFVVAGSVHILREDYWGAAEYSGAAGLRASVRRGLCLPAAGAADGECGRA